MGETTQDPAEPIAIDLPRRKYSRLQILLVILVMVAVPLWLLSMDSFRDTPVWYALARETSTIAGIAIAAAAAQTFISALKWQYVLKRLSAELAQQVGFRRLFAYTAAGQAFSQILPAYIAGPAVRGWIMKTRHAGDFGKNALVSGYEQLFDVMVLVAAGIYALLILLSGESGPFSLAGLLALLAACCLFPTVLPHRAMTVQFTNWVPEKWSVTRRIKESLLAGSEAGLDEPGFISNLLWLSVLRYVVLAVRTVLLGLILLPAVPWNTIALGFSAVQLSALISLTPGNFGITELGWSTLVAFTSKAAIGDFAAFAIALRISGLTASWLILGLSCLPQLFDRSPR